VEVVVNGAVCCISASTVFVRGFPAETNQVYLTCSAAD